MTYEIDSRLDSTRRQTTAGTTLENQSSAVHGPHGGRSTESALGILLLMSTSLDCELFCSRFSDDSCVEVIGISDNLVDGVEQINALRPELVIFDPKAHLPNLYQILSLVKNRTINNLIVLEDQSREVVLLRVLETPRTSYLTRQSSFADIRSAINSVAQKNERVFDRLVQKQIVNTAMGPRIVNQPGNRSIASLTQRELDVLKLVAKGLSVRECAEMLGVSTSTIDNHKARLMKKLKIHKVPKLARLAIREGLISA